MFSIGDVVNIAARLAAAYATGGTSELLRMAADLGQNVLGNVLQDAGIDLSEPVADVIQAAYARGFQG